MGIFDKITNAVSSNKDKVADIARENQDKIKEAADQAIDKAADAADSLTGGKFGDKIDAAAEQGKAADDQVIDTVIEKLDGQDAPQA